jgi:hypothetical protein
MSKGIAGHVLGPQRLDVLGKSCLPLSQTALRSQQAVQTRARRRVGVKGQATRCKFMGALGKLRVHACLRGSALVKAVRYEQGRGRVRGCFDEYKSYGGNKKEMG